MAVRPARAAALISSLPARPNKASCGLNSLTAVQMASASCPSLAAWLYRAPCGLTWTSCAPSARAMASSAPNWYSMPLMMSSGGKCIALRPKFSRSGKLGWAPMATRLRSAQRTLWRMVLASPACQPQAMLAELTSVSSISSLAQPSPRSALRSICMVFLGAVCQGLFTVLRGARPIQGEHGLFNMVQISLLFFPCMQGLFQIAQLELQACVERCLRQLPKIGLDHHADLWVTASGLCIAHQNDRLARWRYLDHARNDAMREQVAIWFALEFAAFKPVAHAIAVGCNAPLVLPQGVACGDGELVEFRTGQHAQVDQLGLVMTVLTKAAPLW